MNIFLDSNIIIYLIENAPVFGGLVQVRLEAAQVSGHGFITSDLAKMETLVRPLRLVNKTTERQFRDFFDSDVLKVLPVSTTACERAAHIRARHRLSSMDSLQLAIAMEAGADLFLTGDKALESFPELKVELVA